MKLDKDEAQLLRTYANGPRIWDAASVFRVVVRLADKGLVAPADDHGVYALTDAGRNELAAGRAWA
jgi:DNA-binding PadR family transcriptional regulator